MLLFGRMIQGLVILVALPATGQPGITADITKTDSLLQQKIAIAVDSVNRLANLQWVKDSLTINAWGDSLRAKMNARFTVDSLQLRYKVDSLSALSLSPEPYASRLDSLVHRKVGMLAEIRDAQQKLNSQTKAKLDGWKQKLQSKLDSLNINASLPGATIPDLANFDLPDFDLPEVPAITAPDFSLPELSPDLARLNKDLVFATPEGLGKIQGNLPGISEQAAGLKSLLGDPAQAAEKALGEVEVVSDLQGQLKNELPVPATEQEAKDQLLDKAIDHFAGQEDKLKQAMQQVARYKQKYPSVQSLSDLPKRPPNPMKGKPLAERLVPGLALQYQYKNAYALDLNFYAGYRLNGRITAGMGWNYRLARDEDNKYWKHQARIFGPRFFGSYELGEGFMAYLETEVMNTFVPYTPVDPGNGQREWVWSMTVGIKKSYTIYKNLKGTVFALYNVFDPHHKAPYVDRLNMRMGVEYKLKARKKGNKK